MKIYLCQPGMIYEERADLEYQEDTLRVCLKEPEWREQHYTDYKPRTYHDVRGYYESFCKSGVRRVLGLTPNQMPGVGEHIEVEVGVSVRGGHKIYVTREGYEPGPVSRADPLALEDLVVTRQKPEVDSRPWTGSAGTVLGEMLVVPDDIEQDYLPDNLVQDLAELSDEEMPRVGEYIELKVKVVTS